MLQDTSRENEAELRFLSKPISTYNNTLIDRNELQRHVSISDPRTWAHPDSEGITIPTQSHLGLPLDILYDIFGHMTVDSLMNLRATNSQIKYMVESWPIFRNLMTDARVAVMALVATQASTLWTFTDLQEPIYSEFCEFCGNHGEILHLLRLQRVCFRCLSTDRRLLAVSDLYLHHITSNSGPKPNHQALPQTRTIPQNSFWGIAGPSFSRVFDWRALVKSQHQACTNINEGLSARKARISRALEHRPRHNPQEKDKQTTSLRVHAKKQRRIDRRSRAQNYIPTTLLNPAESDHAQHACSVFIPILTQRTPTSAPRPIRTLLCAGCSFYYNYHSPLPHQAHTIYPHNTTDWVSETPLTSHLRSCPYAHLYLRTYLNPSSLSANNTMNPFLRRNGGESTAKEIQKAHHQHRAVTLATDRKFIHFKRHVLDTHTSGQGLRLVNTALNNECFEQIPQSALELFRNHRIPCKTDLELELERKLASGTDPTITAMLDASDDHARFDEWTVFRLLDLRHDKAIRKTERESLDRDYVVDSYLDVLLGTDATVSQAHWATACPTSSHCLFRGWDGLLFERKRKQEEYAARQAGTRTTRKISIGGHGWGFDRFGCVSELG